MGLTHLDAGVIIGFLDADNAHHATATSALTQALDKSDQLAMAASAFYEALVASGITAGEHDRADQHACVKWRHDSVRGVRLRLGV